MKLTLEKIIYHNLVVLFLLFPYYSVIKIYNIPVALFILSILIFPSRYEGSPRVIKEALSCGLPVVSYDLEGIKIIDCGSAILPVAKAGDVGGLFDIISKMIKDKGYLKQLSLNGRTHVDNHFSTSVIVKNRIQFIKKILYQ